MNGQIYSQTRKKEYVGNFCKLNTQRERPKSENWVVLFVRGCIKRAILRLAKPEKAQFTKRK